MVDIGPPILSLSPCELEAGLGANEIPVYRGKQIWGWLARGVASFEAMRDLPKALRAALERDFRITSLRSIAVSEADRSLTTKTLFELDGGHSVEAVVMRYSDRTTLCISSQARCPVGCPRRATRQIPFAPHPNSHTLP